MYGKQQEKGHWPGLMIHGLWLVKHGGKLESKWESQVILVEVIDPDFYYICPDQTRKI